ncbi:unnamed protein product [Phaeothamnion confervicola]
MSTPVLLIHGWGGSFALTWQGSGFTELLRDADREVIGVDLLGHGEAPKPHDPAAYTDMTARIIEALPDQRVDAVGFSLGAITLLQLAIREPHRFNRLVLAGIGRNVVHPEPDDGRGERIIAAVEGTAPDSDTGSLVFANYAGQGNNDKDALVAVLRRPRQPDLTAADFARVTCPTLVVIGDRDFAGPGDPLADALPNATLKTLRNTDHFATPESFGFIDATLEFLDALPA